MWSKRRLASIFIGVDLDDDLTILMAPLRVGVKCLERLQPHASILRRRDKNVAIAPHWLAGDQLEGVAPGYAGLFSELRMSQVVADGGERLRIKLVKLSEARAAAQRFNADAPRASEEIEEVGPSDIAPDDIE